MKVSNDALTERVYSNPLWQQTRKEKQPTGENGSM